MIKFDIDSTPLQIQTDSVPGSGDVSWVRFIDPASDIGPGISIKFTDPASYFIGYCLESYFTLPGTNNYRIWTFTKQDSTLQLLCNGEEIFNFKYDEFPEKDCRNMWSSDFSQMLFSSDPNDIVDNASDLYRQYVKGKYRIETLFKDTFESYKS